MLKYYFSINSINWFFSENCNEPQFPNFIVSIFSAYKDANTTECMLVFAHNSTNICDAFSDLRTKSTIKTNIWKS